MEKGFAKYADLMRQISVMLFNKDTPKIHNINSRSGFCLSQTQLNKQCFNQSISKSINHRRERENTHPLE